MKDINKIAKRIGEVHVIKELTLGEYYDIKPEESFHVYNDDGTPAPKSMIGYLLDNEKSGQPWFVSIAYFNENYVYIEDKTEEQILEWAVSAIDEITHVLETKGKQFSSNEQLIERRLNYQLLILALSDKLAKEEVKLLEEWIEDSINGIEKAIASNKELLNSKETLRERQHYFRSALKLLQVETEE